MAMRELCYFKFLRNAQIIGILKSSFLHPPALPHLPPCICQTRPDEFLASPPHPARAAPQARLLCVWGGKHSGVSLRHWRDVLAGLAKTIPHGSYKNPGDRNL